MNSVHRAIKAIDDGWRSSSVILRVAVFLGIGLFIWGFGLFWKFPQGYFALTHFPRLDDFLKLCADPLSRDLNEPIVAYRITVPLLSWLLACDAGVSVIVGWGALAAAYAVCWVALRRETSAFFATLIVLSLSQSFFPVWTIRWLGIPDSVTHLCLALCLLTKRPLVLMLVAVLGMMNDERFLLGLPAVLIWHGLLPEIRAAYSHQSTSVQISPWMILRKLQPVILGVGGGLVVTLIIRHALTEGWVGRGIVRPPVYDEMAHLLTSPRDWQPYDSTWPLFWLNILLCWSWMWGYIFVFFRRGWSVGGSFVMLSCLGYLVAATLSSALVIDISRSMGFLFPFFLAGSVVAFQWKSAKALHMAGWILGLMVLFPALYFTGRSGAVLIPYPIDLLNSALSNQLGTNLLETLKGLVSLRRSQALP